MVLVGRLDSSSADLLEDEISKTLAREPEVLHFDLAALSYISSIGLGLVITALKRMRALGGQFSLGNLQPPIKKVFEIAAALPDESIFASVEEADRYYDSIQRQRREELDG
jgi:anti-sigma B factor antagonist